MGDREPPKLQNCVTEYQARVRAGAQSLDPGWVASSVFRRETWIPEGTNPSDGSCSAVQGAGLPWTQLTHRCIYCWCYVCTAKLREWPQQGSNVSQLDLQKAYLQIRVDKLWWPFQTYISWLKVLPDKVGIWVECCANNNEDHCQCSTDSRWGN